MILKFQFNEEILPNDPDYLTILIDNTPLSPTHLSKLKQIDSKIINILIFISKNPNKPKWLNIFENAYLLQNGEFELTLTTNKENTIVSQYGNRVLPSDTISETKGFNTLITVQMSDNTFPSALINEADDANALARCTWVWINGRSVKKCY